MFKKKVLAVFLVLCVFCASLPTFVSAETVADNYKQAFEVSVKSVKTGKYLQITGPSGAAGSVTGNGNLGDPGTKFTMEYFAYSGQARINFATTNIAPTLRLAEFWSIDGNGGVGCGVFPTDAAPGGWESVSLAAQGDGTVAIRSGRTPDYYLCIDANGAMKVSGVSAPTDAEKFIIETTAVPPAVSGIHFTQVTDKSVTLNWDDLPKDAVYTGYEVYRSDSVDGTYTKVGVETKSTSFKDSSLQKDTTYYYYVKTVNAASPSNESAKASVKTASAPPPSGTAAVNVQFIDSKLHLTWNAVEGATAYNITYAEGKYSDFKTLATNVAGTDYSVAQSISKYSYFKVQPVNAGGAGEWSEPVSLETILFGSNMHFFSPTDNVAAVNADLNQIYQTQKDAQFGTNRYAAYFKPGTYDKLNCIQVGYYTHIGGLGKTPYDTELSNVETPPPSGFGTNALCTFWRSAENFTVLGSVKTTSADAWHADNFNWGVSQAAPIRRINVLKNTWFQWNYGNASGGFAADCQFATTPLQGSQQQYYLRNDKILSSDPTAKDGGWNLVYQGMDANLTPTNWATADGDKQWGNITNIQTTPVIREKPFLYFDTNADEYKVFVPDWRNDTAGISWSKDSMGPGRSITVADDFYVAKADTDTSETINAALDSGKHIFFTPGIYFLDEPIHVKRANTVVMGTGYATLVPSEKNSEGALLVDDVKGAIVAGLLFDAQYSSKYLVKAGEKGLHNSNSDNPILLADLFYRVGGFKDSNVHVDVCLDINADNLVNDHCWAWRADHGAGVGWYRNTCPNGIVVKGNHVTLYGSFVEHFQQYEVLWNGEYGRTYFLQNETPYDAPTQAAYMSHGGTVNGWATYKVSNNVANHYAVGLGMYDVLINNYKNQDAEHGIDIGGEKSSILIANAVEVPHQPNVTIENACITCLSDADLIPRGFEHIINGIGVGTKNAQIGQRNQIVKFQDGIGYGVNNVEILGAVEPKKEPVKTDALKAEIDKANSLHLFDYYDNGKDAFISALSTAKAVLSNPEDQDQVDEALQLLQKAAGGLKLLPSKVELNTVIQQAKGKAMNDYTDLTAERLEAALKKAISVSENTQASADEIADSVQNLRAALNGLIAKNTGSNPSTPISSVTVSVPDSTGKYIASVPKPDLLPAGQMVKFVLGRVTLNIPSSVLQTAEASNGALSISQGPTSSSTFSSIQVIAGNENVVDVFDLNLIGTNGNIHQLGQAVTVTIQLTLDQIAKLQGAVPEIYYYNPTTNTLENLNAAFDLVKGTATFTTTHFSTYVIAKAAVKAPVTSPSTGDDSSKVLVIYLLIVNAAVITVFAFRRRKGTRIKFLR